MAVPQLILSVLVLILSSSLFLLPYSCNAQSLKSCNFDGIYLLGDSISDTGNFIRESVIGAFSPFARLPYGETYFKKATGRCSNGLLIIDFIAISAGLPLLNPIKDTSADFTHGANFAVAGSTALSVEALASAGIPSPVTRSSLDVQVDWMSTHFNSICQTDCANKLRNSLFFVGEIGANDYNYALMAAKTIPELFNMVPNIVEVIINAVKRVISFGATKVIVPGTFPVGCFAATLSTLPIPIPGAFDQNQCLVPLNQFATYYNSYLQNSIEELRKQFPNAIILYGDYYNAYEEIFKYRIGPDATSILKACCGVGGEYNYSPLGMCGLPGVPVCSDPDQHISWDGIHLTQKAYKIMADYLIQDILPKLQCSA
ncbi:acetylajmaline esterase [Sarracenia purpurea var. burkii]